MVTVWRVFAPRCRRNSRATPQLWRPCASLPHDLLTATASIFSPGQYMIDCSVFGECPGGKHNCQISSCCWPCLFVCPTFTDLIFFSPQASARGWKGQELGGVICPDWRAATHRPHRIEEQGWGQSYQTLYLVLFPAVGKFIWFMV